MKVDFQIVNSNNTYSKAAACSVSVVSDSTLTKDKFISFCGKENYTPNEQKAAQYLSEISEKAQKSSAISRRNRWIRENGRFLDYFKLRIPIKVDKNAIIKKVNDFKQAGIAHEDLKKSLNGIVDYYQLSVDETSPNFKELHTNEWRLNQKLRNVRPQIDGKYLTQSQMRLMATAEANLEKRKIFYDATVIETANTMEKDLLDVVNKRNICAKENNFSNYFDYVFSKRYGVDPAKLNQMMNRIETVTEPFMEDFSKRYDDLAKSLGINKKELQSWHYSYIPPGNPVQEVNQYTQSSKELSEMSFDMFKNMGVDIRNLSVEIREIKSKGAMLSAACYLIEPNKDVKIKVPELVNIQSFGTQNHELGHLIYDFGYSENLPFFFKKPPSSSMTEAIAIMTGTISDREPVFERYLKIPKDLSDRYMKNISVDLIASIRNLIARIKFEQELYKNPNQNLSALYYNLMHRYNNTNIPSKPDNVWAAQPHLIASPGYNTNYFGAIIRKEQIYEAAYKELGPITQNKNTVAFLKKHIFQYGSSLTDDEILTRLTGKGVSTEALCRTIKRMKP